MPTYEITTEDVEYLRHGDRALVARLYKPKGDGPFPAVVDLHGGAWTSGDLTGTQGLDQSSGEERVCRRLAEFPPCGRWISDLADRHQLRYPLGQGACARPQDPARPGRHRRPVERRAPRDAGGDAAERYAICFGAVAGRVARGRCDGARGRDVMAGDQPAVALSQCPEAGEGTESAGLLDRHEGKARPVLGAPKPR